MAIKDLFFNIFARDKTGTAFDSVNKRLRETEGVAASMQERMRRAGRAMQRFGVAGSVASAGVAALFRGTLDAYDLQARAEAKVAQAIKATGGAAGFTAEELYSQASALQRLTRFGDEDILNKVTAQFLTFKNVTGDVFKGAQMAALDLSTVLDGDLQSASIMLGKALNDPATGLSALSRAGVTFSEEQKDVIKALSETGQIARAQQLILDEIASAYGGQASAAAEVGAGIVDQWRNTWGDVKEVVGSVLIDALKAILPTLKSLAEAFQNMSPEGQRATVILGALAVALPPLIASFGLLVAGIAAIGAPITIAIAGFSAITAAVVAFWPHIKELGSWLSEKFTNTLTFLGEKLGWLGPIFGALAQGPLAAARLGFDLVGEKGDWLRTKISDVFTAIPQIIGAAVEQVGVWLTEKFNGIIDSVGKKIDWVEGKFFWLYDKVVGNSWVPDLVDEIGQSFAQLNGNMVKPTDTATGQVNESFKSLMGDVGKSLGNLVSQGKLTWKSFMGSLLDIGASYADRIIQDVFNRMGGGLNGAFAQLGSPAIGGASPQGGGLLNGIGASLGNWVGGLLGLDTGGNFTVSGRAGVDRNVTALRLSEGEEVNVTRKGQAASAPVVNVYIQTPNPTAFTASRAQIGAQIGRAVAAGQRAA